MPSHPYPEWTNEKLRTYLEDQGFRVLGVDRDPRAAKEGLLRVNDQLPAEIEDFIASGLVAGADAIVCSCTAWRCLEAADRIEARCGVPVLTSNQAMLWAIGRKLGLGWRFSRGGRLLAGT